MPRRTRPALCVCACFLLTLASAAAGGQSRDLVLNRRAALVIGNNAYPTAPLRNAVADATAIGASLQKLGFQVTVLTDASLPAFERAVDRFATGLGRDDVALFFFAGHGMQIDGDNYLIPVDFRGVDEADVKARSYSATRVQEKLEAVARIRVLILDACRNNPFSTSRSAQRGLSAMQGRGSLVAFSTAAGSTASDNPQGVNGLFTEQLLEVLREPGLTTREVFFRVRERVNDKSAGKQFPWVSDGLIGDPILTGGTPATAAAASPAAVPASRPAESARPAPRLPAPAPGGSRSVIARSLAGDGAAANSVAISPGSVWLAAGYENGEVTLWDPRNGRAVASLTGHVGSVSAVSFSPDGKRLAVAAADRTVRLWNFEEQSETGRLVGHSENVSAIAFTPDGRTVATASADHTVRLWDAGSAAPKEVLPGHRDGVMSVAFTSDGRTLISAGRDSTVRVWDVGRARERMMFEAASAVWSVAVTRDSTLIAAGSDDGSVTVWNADTGQIKWTGTAHKGAVWALTFSGDGAMLATGGADGLVKTWDTASFKSSQTFRGHATWVRSVAFDSSNTWLASGSGDGDVRTWRVAAVK